MILCQDWNHILKNVPKWKSIRKMRKPFFFFQSLSCEQRLDALKMFDLDHAREKIVHFFLSNALVHVLLAFTEYLFKHNGFPHSQPTFFFFTSFFFFFFSQLLRVEVTCVILRHDYNFFSAEAQSSYSANFCLPLLSSQSFPKRVILIWQIRGIFMGQLPKS